MNSKFPLPGLRLSLTRPSATVYPVPLDDISAQALYDSGSISPHGRGTETVIDTSYRDAHEVKVSGHEGAL